MPAQEVEALLEDPQNARIDPHLKAAFALAKAMTESPLDRDAIARALQDLQQYGVGETAIHDAIAIPHHFNYINRVADAFDFPLPQGNATKRLGRLLDWAKMGISTKRPQPYLARDNNTGLELPVELLAGSRALLKGPAYLDPATRQGIEGFTAQLRGAKRDHTQAPDELETLLKKIATDAYKIVDEDIQDLSTQGYTKDQIFEIIVCASWGAAMAPLEAAYGCLQRPDERKRKAATSSNQTTQTTAMA